MPRPHNTGYKRSPSSLQLAVERLPHILLVLGWCGCKDVEHLNSASRSSVMVVLRYYSYNAAVRSTSIRMSFKLREVLVPGPKLITFSGRFLTYYLSDLRVDRCACRVSLQGCSREALRGVFHFTATVSPRIRRGGNAILAFLSPFSTHRRGPCGLRG